MSGFFAVAAKEDCVLDLFFGTDYHSHLGTRRGGMAVFGKQGFERAIHNIENSPFRTKFEKDLHEMEGHYGIGCISDYEPQPLIVRSHHGTYSIATIGKINNTQEIVKRIFAGGHTHFLEMSGGDINTTELIASIINQMDTLTEGIQHAWEMVDGSVSILLLMQEGIYVARDKMGRTPVAIGKKEDAMCAAFESFSYMNLGYVSEKELGPGEIVLMTSDAVTTLCKPQEEMKMCSFLWVYYGYPSSSYEGTNVEQMRYQCGSLMAKRDVAIPDTVAGVPDSGTAYAIGYANETGIPFSRPFIKYSPTWSRSFIPIHQSERKLTSKMKILPVKELIQDKSLLLIDDSIVSGNQLRETTAFLYRNGANAVHVRPACPPILYSCKYLNFSRVGAGGELGKELVARRAIARIEGEQFGTQEDALQQMEERILSYTDPESECYQAMVMEIGKELNFTSLQYHRLDDMMQAIGVDPCKLCTYCWNGKE